MTATRSRAGRWRARTAAAARSTNGRRSSTRWASRSSTLIERTGAPRSSSARTAATSNGSCDTGAERYQIETDFLSLFDRNRDFDQIGFGKRSAWRLRRTCSLRTSKKRRIHQFSAFIWGNNTTKRVKSRVVHVRGVRGITLCEVMRMGFDLTIPPQLQRAAAREDLAVCNEATAKHGLRLTEP